MPKRFVSIWFRYLRTDWFTRRQPTLSVVPFVFAASDHGRMIVTTANALARHVGIQLGMAVAAATAQFPPLQVLGVTA